MARGRAAGYDEQRELILVRAAALFAQSGYPAIVSERRDGKRVKLAEWTLFFIKHWIIEFYSHPALPHTLTVTFVKNEETITMNYNANLVALFTGKVFWGFH